MSRSCAYCLAPLIFWFLFEQKSLLVLANKPACLLLNCGKGSSELQVRHVHLPRAEQLSVVLLCGFIPRLPSKSGDLLETRNGQVKRKRPAEAVPCPSSPSVHLCAALAVRQDDWADSPSMLCSLSLAMSRFTQVSAAVITQLAVCCQYDQFLLKNSPALVSAQPSSSRPVWLVCLLAC